MMTLLRSVALKVFILAAMAVLLSGYVEPLPLLLHNLEEKMRGFNGLTVDGSRVLIDPVTGTKTHQPFQLELMRPSGIKLEVVDQSSGETTVDPLPGHIHQALTTLLLSHDKVALFKQLAQWGVRKEPLGLSRLEGEICVIVGAYENQLGSSQFWVEKFNHHPARLITVSSVGGKAFRTDIQFVGWDNPVTAGLFPKTVRFYRGDKLIESWEISGVDKRGAK